MMSMRRKSRALLIRKPIPLSALICSATISVSHAIGQRLPHADEHLRCGAGHDDGAEPLPEREAQHLRGFEELRIDLADGREGIQVQRKAHAERDQQHLGQLADAEPQDEQRDQAEVRQCANHLHRRVDGRLDPPRQPDSGSQCHTEESAEQQALDDPNARHPQRVSQLPVLDQLDARPRRSVTAPAAHPAGSVRARCPAATRRAEPVAREGGSTPTCVGPNGDWGRRLADASGTVSSAG